MKKLFTLLSLSIAITASAQSFSVYKTVNGNATQTLTNGGVITEATAVNNTTETKIKIKNNAAVTQTFTVVRRVISASPAFINNNSSSTPNTYFCFGFNCFGSATDVPGPSDYTVLLASGQTATTFPTSDNSTSNGQPFTIYVDEGTVMGDYVVRYGIHNVANNADSLEFFVAYNNGQVGLTENSNNVSSLKAFPNPAQSFVNLVMNNPNTEAITVSVYNTAGELVKAIDAPKNSGNTLQISTDDMADGLYEVVIKGNTTIQRTKVVIIK